MSAADDEREGVRLRAQIDQLQERVADLEVAIIRKTLEELAPHRRVKALAGWCTSCGEGTGSPCSCARVAP